MEKSFEEILKDALKNDKPIDTQSAIDGIIQDLQKKIDLSTEEFLKLREIVKKAHKK